jgi:hypothetical protein
MDMDEDMVLSVVKNQLTHFRVKKVIDEECNDPLTWWRAEEGHFSNVKFVAHQILGIMGSQIEAEIVFNIASIYTNLCRSGLGTKNLVMFISIYKNWPEDARVEGFSIHAEIHGGGGNLNGQE